MKKTSGALLRSLEERCAHLEIFFSALVFNRFQKMSVIRLRKSNSRKEIGSDAIEKWKVVRQELGKINVDDRTKH